ncbi:MULTISPECIES: hypothetical protein [unclassified Achromobacter]|uniref:hypothetical protein n=1 Tax=unclassified Achromobacter TaxID=2626865 RepID=UPI001177BDCC|nr:MULTISPECIES: hypothetical protein [unclassified Achromobacter]
MTIASHADPGDLNPGKGNICIRVCMEEFDGTHPAIKDHFVGEPIAPLVALARYALWGPYMPPLPEFVNFVPAINPYSQDMVPDAGATVTPDLISSRASGGRSETGQTAITCTGFTAEKIIDASPISPDYGVAYIAAYENFTVPGMPISPQCIPWTALFTIRIWHAPTAMLTYANGNQQTTAPFRNFAIPLSMITTDSAGSQRAVNGMQVFFDIVGNTDAIFDASGVTTRYCQIVEEGRRAIVISQEGVAISPPVKAGALTGSFEVIGTSRIAGNGVSYALTVA